MIAYHFPSPSTSPLISSPPTFPLPKTELDRIKECMTRMKELEDRQKAPKINKDAAKRFVRSALWQQAQQKTHKTELSGEESSNRGAGEEDGEPPTKKLK